MKNSFKIAPVILCIAVSAFACGDPAKTTQNNTPDSNKTAIDTTKKSIDTAKKAAIDTTKK